MSRELKYKVLFVKSEEASVNFFVSQLGFQEYQPIEIDGRACPVLQDQHNGLMAFVDDSCNAAVNVLNTDDCLRDYCFFKHNNVPITGRPEYDQQGLRVGFNDPSGSHFVLLEERNYTDA